MSLESDLLIDRARLKRRLGTWRVVAVVAVVAALIAAAGPRHGLLFQRRHVARLVVSGIITDNRKLIAAIDRVATDPSAAALEVYVDSPGGTVAGGEGIHDAIERVVAKKPVVTVMSGVAASAGYMISVPANRIFARASTLTGSIGVILETAEIAPLLQKLGIDAGQIVSGPLKGQPSFTQPLTPEAHQVLQGLVMDMYGQFVDIVAKGRHMDPARVRQLADGRPYTGRQALALGLIDQIGDEHSAREWLAAHKGIPISLPYQDVHPERGFIARELAGSWLGPLVGLLKSQVSQGLMLDGAWAIWQPR